MQEPFAPEVSPSSKFAKDHETGLNKSETCGDAASAADNCRNEIAAIQLQDRAAAKAPVSQANELEFDQTRAGIKVADVPTPGTGDDRLLVPPHIEVAPNPYIAGQPKPYNAETPSHPAPWGRPEETVPSKIEKPNEFTKALLSATQQAAARIETAGDCARGVREAFNDLKSGFHIYDNMKIDDQKYRWRSAVQFGEYLSASGLFDVVPLDKLKNKLEDGFVVVRNWNDALIKSKGENRGDIAVVSHNGYQYNDHHEPYQPNESRYSGGYALVPKGYVYQNIAMEIIEPRQKTHEVAHGHGHHHGYEHIARHGHGNGHDGRHRHRWT